MKAKTKQVINSILSFMFPFHELNDRQSVLLSDTWLERIMKPTQIKDWLWSPSKTTLQ